MISTIYYRLTNTQLFLVHWPYIFHGIFRGQVFIMVPMIIATSNIYYS